MDVFLAQAVMLVPLLVFLGLLAGFMAGLLGVGGGIVLVPGLYYLFKTLGHSESLLMHLAVGTSLAIIIPTGLSSAMAHARQGAVRFDLVRHIGPGIVAGVAAGTWLASGMNAQEMKTIFAVALICFAVLMQLPSKKTESENRSLGFIKGSAGGFIVGGISSLMGIGGATLNVPFMTLNGIAIHNAVASASALGPFIALPGAIGFMIIGWHESGLPPFSLGYVNLLAFCVIAPLGVLAAPYGARVAHKVSVTVLRRIFSIFIVMVAARMLMDAYHG